MACLALDLPVPDINRLRVKLFGDGADLNSILNLCRNPLVRGFTTNPTLMRKAGIADYGTFARRVLSAVAGLPVSFEVFADDFAGMERQARIIASWGANVYVKVPVTTTAGDFTGPLIRRLSADGIALNVTALLTLSQVRETAEVLSSHSPAILSVFAGRIADTGVDPVPMLQEARVTLRHLPLAELLWASPRELLNIFQADEAGCDIITAPPEILAKLPLVGRDLADYSLDTVKMFHADAIAAGYVL